MVPKCRMAVLGLTEQRLLRRAGDTVMHYERCLERLENFAESMSVGDRQQDLFGEGFESDEEDFSVENAPPAPKKSCQGRIQFAPLTQVHELTLCRSMTSVKYAGHVMELTNFSLPHVHMVGESSLDGKKCQAAKACKS